MVNGVILFTIHCSLFTVLSSCSLDENPKDQIPEEEAYADAGALYRNTVATLYNYIGGATDGQGLQGTCRGIYDLQTFGSDEAMIPTRGTDWYDGGIWQELYRHDWTPGHPMLGNAWSYLYKVITLCNRSLELLESHQHLLDEVQYVEYTAEVRALRAIYYWYLMDLFGRIPIITTSKTSLSQLQQMPRSQIFKFVCTELQQVCPNLHHENSARPGDYYGRVTYHVACFVLAKLMLNAEVYLDNNWTDGDHPDGSALTISVDGKTMNAWEATIYYCNQLENADYELEELYSSNFEVHNENSNENIWVIPMDKDLYYNEMQYFFRSWHYRHAAAYGFTGENGACATKRTLEIFKYGTWSEDPRFLLNYYDGIVFDNDRKIVRDRNGEVFEYKPWEVELDLSDSPYLETAGARMNKYVVDRNATKNGKLMDNDIVLFRLADVLLMHAEALLRNGQAEEGQDYFNAVRGRVDAPEKPLTLQNLLDERLLELCWEGWRRQDLIRFGQYESLFMGDQWDAKVDERDRHTTVFPIPGGMINFNPNLTQNPGY
jgi:hypothetical protein